MVGAMLRAVFGFILACLAAGATMVGFVVTPVEIAGGNTERLAAAGALTLLTATDCARFATPLALIAAAIAEWRSIRNWIFYAAAGIAIAMAGFLALYLNSAAGQPAFADIYALTAFLTAGIAGGFVYWLVAGRLAGCPADNRALTGGQDSS
jgi:hypothetical protein